MLKRLGRNNPNSPIRKQGSNDPHGCVMAYQEFSESSMSNAFKPLRSIFLRAAADDFSQHVLTLAQEPRFKRNLDIKKDYSTFECWMTSDKTKGFAVSPDRELTNVFSMVRATGGGREVMDFVTSRYDSLHLNCYAGALERFYIRHGFHVSRREQNWAGDKYPAIVYMHWQR